VAVDLVGGRTRPLTQQSTPPALAQQTSRGADMFQWSNDLTGMQLQEHFAGSPLLRVTDVTTLHIFPKPDKTDSYTYFRETGKGLYAPRVFSECWFLIESIEPDTPLFPPLFRMKRWDQHGSLAKKRHVFQPRGTSRWTHPHRLLDRVLEPAPHIVFKDGLRRRRHLNSCDSILEQLSYHRPPLQKSLLRSTSMSMES